MLIKPGKIVADNKDMKYQFLLTGSFVLNPGLRSGSRLNPPKRGKKPLVLAALLALLFFSCAGLPERRESLPETVPERPVPSAYIMGKGQVPEKQLALFLERHNPQADRDFVQALTGYYIEEAAFEGVNHDAAFAQMCLETGFLRYGGLVTPDMNNFCGLGAIGPERPGESFPDPRTGVRAHIQHLKAYATDAPLNGTLVDPRYKWVRYGSSPTIHGLSGSWASDLNYSGKIEAILRRIYEFSF